MHVFKWLHENRKEGYTQRAISIALSYNRKDIVQYMTDHKMIYTSMRGKFGDHINSRWTNHLFYYLVPRLVVTDREKGELLSGVLCRDICTVRLYKGQHIAMYSPSIDIVVISVPRDNSQVTKDLSDTDWWNKVPCEVFTTSYEYIRWLVYDVFSND